MKTLTRIVSVVTLVLGVVSLAVGGMNIGVFYGGLGGTEVGDAVAAALSGVVVVLLMAGGLMDLVLRPAGPARGQAARRLHRGGRLRRPRGHPRRGGARCWTSPSQRALGLVSHAGALPRLRASP